MLVERLSILCLLTVLAPSVTPVLITNIQGISYRSSYVGQTLDGITGVVTAKVCPLRSGILAPIIDSFALL